MGCKISKDGNDKENIVDCQVKADERSEATMSEKVDYKSRLEWKMCIVSDFFSSNLIWD